MTADGETPSIAMSEPGLHTKDTLELRGANHLGKEHETAAIFGC